MFKILGILVLGVLLGHVLKNLSFFEKSANKVIMLVIYALLFLLGVSIGKNDVILNNLDSLGVQAWWLTFGAVLGSVIAAKIVYGKFFKASTNEG